jgi:ribosomal protein S18 acetylase RimI-like enzyme
MLTSVADRQSEFTGLRPFNPLRDIGPMTELLELSFGENLDEEGRQTLREMRTVAYLLGPLLWLLGRTPSRLRDLFSGYVWVEEGRIVGNITVHRPYGERKGWFISNLAVHPDHRRQAIGRRLMTEGIRLARQRGAQRVSLEVRASNLAAKKLYDALDFSRVDSMSKMRLGEASAVRPVSYEGYRVTLVKPGEWEKRYRLAQDSFTPEAKEISPIEESDYRLNPAQLLLRTVSDVLKGQTVHLWAAQEDSQFLAVLALRTGGAFFPHFLELMVHPEHRGEVEEPLLTRALATLNSYPSRPVLARIRPSYRGVLDLFKSYGFVEEQTLDLFTLRLS